MCINYAATSLLVALFEYGTIYMFNILYADTLFAIIILDFKLCALWVYFYWPLYSLLSDKICDISVIFM